MKTDTGKLIKAKKGFQVTLPTRRGSSNFPIPQAALCFDPADGADGLEVEVQRDDANRIVKVTIPGKAEVAPRVDQPKGKHGGRGSGRHQGGGGQRGGGTVARRKLKKASPRALGLAFHNPYTFIPFTQVSAPRSEPTLQTADEDQSENAPVRYTGIVRLSVKTESPLLTCDPDPISDDGGHKTYQALCIGDDVIVPATGIRGALRTLMTVLTGGTLGYLNRNTFLCQGRDAVLGPRGKNSPPGTPANCFLGKVTRAGSANRPGKVQLGETRLISAEKLEKKTGRLDRLRKPSAKPLYVTLDGGDNIDKVYKDGKNVPNDAWQVRLSGRPVNRKGKREALFLANGEEISLPPDLWGDYAERNRHGDRTDPRNGDLVWLQPFDPEIEEIRNHADIASIQWSRWGRSGQKLESLIRSQAEHVLPDTVIDDGEVDQVTDLFGQVPEKDSKKSIAFAGRVMPENLVFFDAKSKVQPETLAPLAPPHPGCVALNRDNDNPDEVSAKDGLPGYKVYRTTNETGDQAPWKFSVQGVYGEQGELLKPQQKVNKTCDLLPADCDGHLSITFRSLTQQELALLLQSCDLPWRVGGGKPLGLGRCKVRIVGLLDELGDDLKVDPWLDESGALQLENRPWRSDVEHIQERVATWIATQQPVKKLRYPRAVSKNNHRKSRGGHVWFARHGQPRMMDQPGLGPMYIDGKLLKQVRDANEELDMSEPMISGQVLPAFNPEDPTADQLYGYDGYGSDVQRRQRPTRNVYAEYEPFDPTKHVTGNEKSSANFDKKTGESEDGQIRKDSKFKANQKKRGHKKDQDTGNK